MVLSSHPSILARPRCVQCNAAKHSRRLASVTLYPCVCWLVCMNTLFRFMRLMSNANCVSRYFAAAGSRNTSRISIHSRSVNPGGGLTTCSPANSLRTTSSICADSVTAPSR